MVQPYESENGWRPRHAGADILNWVYVPGADKVSLQFMKGWPTVILRAFAADFNAYVERLRDADSAAFTPTNSVATSNHLNGTAMDLNWNGSDGRTFRLGISEERAYPDGKAAKLRELIRFYEGTVFCGGNWDIRDWMHFQMGGTTWNNPRTQDFINRKIRPDGFSTFRREGLPATHVEDAIGALSQAIGVPEATAVDLLPDIKFGLLQSECNTPLRIAHWLAQMGHESAGWVATEEYADGPESENRWKYKGRTWIQITWMENYRKFGHWLHSKSLLDDPEFFVNNPKVLAAKKWRAVGPAWYWTQTVRSTRRYHTCNDAADHDDIVTVTQIINGGTNGLPDRQNRYNRAIALGDRLMDIIGEEDELADPAVVNKINEIHAALRDSVSMYATGPGQETSQSEAYSWDDRVESSALRGEDWALSLVLQAGNGTLFGVLRKGEPDQFLVEHARAVYREALAKNGSKV